MGKRSNRVLLVVLSALGCVGAGFAIFSFPPRAGGPCAYRNITGVAVITAILSADPQSYNDQPDPVEVVYDFIPDRSNAPSGYKFPDFPDTGRRLTVGAGMNPTRKYVEVKGIAVGNRYTSVRKEIVSGACTPVVFEFLNLDLSDYTEKR